MIKRQVNILGALAPLVLAGCDRLYGVQSRTAFETTVNVRCVHEVISSISEAQPVTYHRDESSSIEILPKQRKVHTVTHLWLYGERGTSSLQLNQTPDGWEFSNSRLRMGRPVPEDEMARFIPLMHEVNKALAARCQLPVGEVAATQV